MCMLCNVARVLKNMNFFVTRYVWNLHCIGELVVCLGDINGEVVNHMYGLMAFL